MKSMVRMTRSDGKEITPSMMQQLKGKMREAGNYQLKPVEGGKATEFNITFGPYARVKITFGKHSLLLEPTIHVPAGYFSRLINFLEKRGYQKQE